MKRILTIWLFSLLFLSVSAKGFVTHCTITTYNATKGQCDSTPHITADGTRIDNRKVKAGTQRIVAVSRDLLPYLPYGTVIEIEGHGQYVVADTMHPRFSHRVDILLHPSAKHFKKTNIKVRKV